MAKISSQPTIRKIIRGFKKDFNIIKESGNKFDFDGVYYSPDLVFRDKKTSKIKVILEVEQGTRKHVVGGVITADYCMGKLKEKPVMMVLALTKQDEKDYLKRQKMIEQYIKNIKEIVISDYNGIIRALRNTDNH